MKLILIGLFIFSAILLLLSNAALAYFSENKQAMINNIIVSIGLVIAYVMVLSL